MKGVLIIEIATHFSVVDKKREKFYTLLYYFLLSLIYTDLQNPVVTLLKKSLAIIK